MLTKYPEIDLSLLSEKTRLIIDSLFEQAKQYSFRCFLVLDPFLSTIDDDVINFLFNTNRVTQVKIMHPAILAQKRPLIIELNLQDEFDKYVLSYSVDKAQSELLPQNILYSDGRQYCGWLFTKGSIEQIAEDFANLALQKERDGNYLLRFYDPAIFPQLLTILTSSQQQKLYGKIDCWSLLDGNGELINCQNYQKKRAVLSGELNLISTAQDQLFCISINNLLLKKYRIECANVNISECESLTRIKPSLLRLLAKDISDESLMIEWGKLALTYHPDFDLTPEVIESTVGFTTHYDYYKWLTLLSESDWLNITTESTNLGLEK